MKNRFFGLIGMVLMYHFLPINLQAQGCNLSLRGQVLNADTGLPMSYAGIVIKETKQGVQSDEHGHYQLNNICPGEYTLVCSHLGCDHAEQKLNLRSNMVLDIAMKENAVTLENLVVTGTTSKKAGTQTSSELSGVELDAGRGLGLGESLKRLSGVSTLNTGATISKPVIQGLHSNRILIFNNGVRLEGQQWGNEHAPEVDPFTAERITVIKGASSVRYGADALGGIILLEPKPIRRNPGMGGELHLQGFSNGRSGIVSSLLEGKLGKLPLSGRIQGTLKRVGNLQTPNYYLNNTGVSESNFSWIAKYQPENWVLETFYSRFFTQLGILRDSHIGNLTDLENAIERGRPLQDGGFSYELGRPLQKVMHETFRIKAAHSLSESSKLSLQLSRQFNRRQEFDAHRRFNPLPETLDDPSIEFEITTWAAELNWDHRLGRNWRGALGSNTQSQVNTVDRGALIPNFDNLDWGLYWTERHFKTGSPWEFEFGLRYDLRHLHVAEQGTTKLNEDRNFQNWSGSLGLLYAFDEQWKMRFNTGSAWRSPLVNELFSSGVHHGSASYEEGNPDLQPERGFNNSLTLEGTHNDQWSLALTTYYNLIQDFIYLQPRGEAQLTIRGAFPAFDYRQADARLMGIDWMAECKLYKNLRFESKASLLNGWNRELEDYLIFMPPLRFEQGLKLGFNEKKHPDHPSFVRISVLTVLQQRQAPATDYAAPPPGFTRVDAELFHTLEWGKQRLELGISVFNLFNVEYREYLNRFRYFSAEMGRNLGLRLKVPFNFS
ncbi:TonB-dependent receptor [Haliscomenobacter hydrossis]|uniref:TonB-dependent receptor n=1 Tax=Haliscomenobacter hydrossis (strain ATCC 27775 / DSM 1100 / LMG 10767 / O) TaxID=760192 RepID=F4KW60_HALH1|nr:TonB-dependent receptor [Haliscomenobacter hydrossis]AEE49248.1 TonB-dependent receptor [Haliscomenobacter hydrossis DSM 1100]